MEGKQQKCVSGERTIKNVEVVVERNNRNVVVAGGGCGGKYIEMWWREQ